MSNDSGNTGLIVTEAIQMFAINWEKMPHRKKKKIPHREDSRTFQRGIYSRVEFNMDRLITLTTFVFLLFFMQPSF